MEIDIFIPVLKVGIEYDGEAFHKEKSSQDILKTESILKNGISLIRIREPKLEPINDGSIVFVTLRPTGSLEYLEKTIIELASYLNKTYNCNIIPDVSINRDYDAIIQSVHGIITNKSLGVLYPEIAKEWNYEKNGTLSPYEFLSGSSIKVWWKCAKCGYEWKAVIGSRKDGHSCPVCSGKAPLQGVNDLKTLYPNIAKEWDYEKNLSSPDLYLPNSAKKVWWKCANCGHSWKTTINNRISNNSGCPICSEEKRKATLRHNTVRKKMSFAKKHPELLEEWDFAKNDSICSPTEITSGVHEKVWWKCSNCGHEWEAYVYSRSEGRGCPKCARKKIKG